METIIRVLVANRPRLLRELVMTTLSEQAGISVVGETDDERDVPSLVEKTKPSRSGVRRCAICCCENFPRCGSLRWHRTRTLEFITGRHSKSTRR